MIGISRSSTAGRIEEKCGGCASKHIPPDKAKANSILRVLASGVPSVHLLDGRVPHSIIGELFTDNGVGSWIRA